MLITILGPTATGKTALAARLAYECSGEVISADSRQVYRGMDIGTGKDLGEYVINGTRVPNHLIDIVDPGYEYNIFEYQRDFLKAYQDIVSRNRLPVLCGGSGMYLEAVLKGYRLAAAAGDDTLLAALEKKPFDELVRMLKSYKTLHNTTDVDDRSRLIKAIMVANAALPPGLTDIHRPGPEKTGTDSGFPKIESLVIGVSYPRELQMVRIAERLEYRLEHGMIAEVETLLKSGITAERLMKYGLEYRFVTLFLTGKISRADLFFELNIAIRQFAKRQMTWFRRMERQGIKIHWIDGQLPAETKLGKIRAIASGVI